jgi:hypothetical protein
MECADGGVLLGGIVGGIGGAIAAVDVAIYAGTDDGYEASHGEVFQESSATGVIVVALLLIGPIAGAVLARAIRRRRAARSGTA